MGLWALAALLFSTPVSAQGIPDSLAAPFSSARLAALSSRSALLSRHQAAAVSDARGRLQGWLGLFDELQSRGRLTPADVEGRILAGLASGRWKSLVFGETHSVEAERRFAVSVLTSGLSRGLVFSGLIRENFTFPETGFLAAAGVPVVDYGNQFQPDPYIGQALKAWRKGIPVSYTGNAHSCEKIKDYHLYTLLTGRVFGYGPGLKDMPTVERSLQGRGKKPVIAAMLTEEFVLGRIQQMFLKSLVEGGADAASLRAGLEEVLAAWNAKLSSYPPAAGSLFFVEHPKQDDLFVGLTPSDRRPQALETAYGVVASPDAAAFLAGHRVRLLEALWHSDGSPDGSVNRYYDIILHRDDGEKFTRTVGPLTVRAGS